MESATNTHEAKGKRLPKPNNIVSVPVGIDTGFFKWWCVFLRPFINLTNKEIDVVASLLKQRYELSKCISDPAILDVMLMSEETKKKIVQECSISNSHFYVIVSNLRKHKVIVENRLNPRLIPNIRKDDNGCFQLLILFKENQNQKSEK